MNIKYRQRSFLYKLLSVVTALLILGEACTFAVGAHDGTKTPVKHLIILMMENHTFDNLFGEYGKTSSGKTASGVTIPFNLLSHPVSQNLSAVAPGNFSTSNPYEGYYNYHRDWNNGSMNGFLNGSGPSSLYYFTADQMALQWDIAQNYAMGDMYFSSTLSETLPNRLYSLAAYSPVKQDQSSPPPYVPYNRSIFSELDSHGTSWSYYFLNPTYDTNPLNFISGIGGESQHIGTWQQFENSVQNGSLPSVSWVSSIGGGAENYSQHPPENVLMGEIWLFSIMEMLMHSSLWESSAIFVTYDEGGGYYDQVAPPTIGNTQLGFRVPFIVISPYAKEDYVSHTVMTHTSIIGFIDYNWEMPPLNLLVSHSNIPIDLFNFNSSYPDGNVARSPFQFNSPFQKFFANSLDFNESMAQQFQNIGYLFPSNLQFNVSTLGYPTQGASEFNLSQVTDAFYVPGNHTASLSLDYVIYGIAVAAAIVVGSAFIFHRYGKSRRR